MRLILRLLVVAGMAVAGLLLAIEIQAHRQARRDRRPRAEASAEVQRALLETAATVSPEASDGARRVSSAPPPPAPHAATSGTTPLGVAAALVVVALTGWVLYRLAA